MKNKYNDLTELERNVLSIMRTDDFYENGVDSILWGDVLSDTMRNCGIYGKTYSGVLSSLNKKGYLSSSGTGRDGVVELLERGKEYMKDIFGDD